MDRNCGNMHYTLFDIVGNSLKQSKGCFFMGALDGSIP